MIFPSNRVWIVVATKPVDFRKGHDRLVAPVKNALRREHIYDCNDMISTFGTSLRPDTDRLWVRGSYSQAMSPEAQCIDLLARDQQLVNRRTDWLRLSLVVINFAHRESLHSCHGRSSNDP